jgi:hypothetical protein
MAYGEPRNYNYTRGPTIERFKTTSFRTLAEFQRDKNISPCDRYFSLSIIAALGRRLAASLRFGIGIVRNKDMLATRTLGPHSRNESLTKMLPHGNKKP